MDYSKLFAVLTTAVFALTACNKDDSKVICESADKTKIAYLFDGDNGARTFILSDTDTPANKSTIAWVKGGFDQKAAERIGKDLCEKGEYPQNLRQIFIDKSKIEVYLRVSADSKKVAGFKRQPDGTYKGPFVYRGDPDKGLVFIMPDLDNAAAKVDGFIDGSNSFGNGLNFSDNPPPIFNEI